jgi:dTMP kinase
MSSNTSPARGQFIVLEGPDGSGKSTAAPYLTAQLNAAGIPAVATHEVGGTAIGQALRALIYTTHPDEVLDPTARLLLIYAARIQNLKRVVEPALAQGIAVVCDRFSDSTFVYQGKEDGLNYFIQDFECIEEVRYLAQRPDHLLFFDVSAKTSLARQRARGTVDNTQYKGDLVKTQRIVDFYQERMRAVVLQRKNAVVHIEAEQAQDQVFKQLSHFASTLQVKLSHTAPKHHLIKPPAKLVIV